MGNSKEDVDREFFAIVCNLGARPEIAKTLDDFLLAAPSQHRASDASVKYVLSKLWIDPLEGSR